MWHFADERRHLSVVQSKEDSQHDTYHDKYHDRYHDTFYSLMTPEELEEHITQLRRTNSDLTHIEAKLATNELPKRLWQTLSAFSNTRMGGSLLLGIAEESGFGIIGVKNSK